jgi:hypothetical protein
LLLQRSGQLVVIVELFVEEEVDVRLCLVRIATFSRSISSQPQSDAIPKMRI